MGEPFIGSEALAAGRLTRYELRSRFVAVHQDVYVAKGTLPNAVLRAKATAIDALARAARLKAADIALAAERHVGRKGIRRAQATIALVDPGSESPRETWLRLLVVRDGYPAPQTQYPIFNEYGALIGEADMAWPELKIALEYEGRHHTDPDQFRKDIARIDEMTDMGWIVIRVTSRDGEASVLGRLRKAWALRA
ncbi:endonuclease domain-containing protein [Mycolicibacterium senegalense]|uniref:endonuclease domain-containing protein n=1 Tax=Mycolicibacterium TaxID=1866885 RepID=UPI0032047C8B